jgi:hypothetical protein
MILIMFFGSVLVCLAQNNTFESLVNGKTMVTLIGIALLIAAAIVNLTQLLDDWGLLNTTVLIKYLQEDSL